MQVFALHEFKMVGEDILAIQKVEVVAFAGANAVYNVHKAVVRRVDIITGKVEIFSFIEDQFLGREAVCFEYGSYGLFHFGFFVEVDEIISGGQLQEVVLHELELILSFE